jgi:hypothetical protein
MSERLIARLAYKGHPVVIHIHSRHFLKGHGMPVYSVTVDRKLVFMDPCFNLEEAYDHAREYVDRKETLAKEEVKNEQ